METPGTVDACPPQGMPVSYPRAVAVVVMLGALALVGATNDQQEKDKLLFVKYKRVVPHRKVYAPNAPVNPILSSDVQS